MLEGDDGPELFEAQVKKWAAKKRSMVQGCKERKVPILLSDSENCTAARDCDSLFFLHVMR